MSTIRTKWQCSLHPRLREIPKALQKRRNKTPQHSWVRRAPGSRWLSTQKWQRCACNRFPFEKRRCSLTQAEVKEQDLRNVWRNFVILGLQVAHVCLGLSLSTRLKMWPTLAICSLFWWSSPSNLQIWSLLIYTSFLMVGHVGQNIGWLFASMASVQQQMWLGLL